MYIHYSGILTVSKRATIVLLSELYARGTVYQQSQSILVACCSLKRS